MQKPHKPYPPDKNWEKYSAKYTDEVVLLKHYYTNDDINEEEYIENLREGMDDDDPLPQVELFSRYKHINLAEILEKIPQGVDLKLVNINLERDRYFDHIEFSVTYKKPTDHAAQKELFKQDQKAYKDALAKYETDLTAYEAWLLQTTIAEKEKELSELKSSLKTRKA